MQGCICKPDRYNDRRICKMLTYNKTVTSINVQIAYLDLDTDHSRNKPLHIESVVRYKHHMQVMMGYCYIDKEN
jgi:hypothetical protein